MSQELQEKQWNYIALLRDVGICLAVLLVLVCCKFLFNEALHASKGQEQTKLTEQDMQKMTSIIVTMEDEQKSAFSIDGYSIIEVALPPDSVVSTERKGVNQ